MIAFTRVAALGAGPAHADSASVITGSLGGTSDFVFRGLSLTRGKPAAQASLDVEFPKEFYVGAFVATADPNPGPSPPVEMDFWAGRYWHMSEDFSGDLRLSQYTYPDDPRRVSYNRTELTAHAGLSQPAVSRGYLFAQHQGGRLFAGYEEGNAWAVEMSGRHPLNDRFSISAGLGHYGLDEIYHDSYNYWNATLTATLKPFELQLAYLGVDESAKEHFADDSVGDRVALTALWRFSSAN